MIITFLVPAASKFVLAIFSIQSCCFSIGSAQVGLLANNYSGCLCYVKCELESLTASYISLLLVEILFQLYLVVHCVEGLS